MKETLAAMAESAAIVEKTLDRVLPKPIDTEAVLFEAMRYATLGGGKRIRPFLVMASAQLFGVAELCAQRVAAAIECVHCYSLIHDDLPALDDDPTRRGKPATHVRFGEATAILAGDALLTLAFELLADSATHADPQVRCTLMAALARAAGCRGLAGGQMLYMIAARDTLDIGAVTRVQRLKTGELFAVACEAGAILGRADGTRRQALHAYAHDLGLAFQITDDLLDVEGRDEAPGETKRRHRGGKGTFIALLGVDRARAQARMLAEQAIVHLDIFEQRADRLRGLARFVVERRA